MRQEGKLAEPPLTAEKPKPPSPYIESDIAKPALSDEKIYEETAKVIAVFWEWRHKTLTRFFAVVGGVIALVWWPFQQANGVRIWHSIPLFVGSVFSCISYLLDTRHAKIFVKGYCIAANLESKGRKEGAIYEYIRVLHKKPRSLTQILRIMYLTSAIVFLISALCVVIIVLS